MDAKRSKNIDGLVVTTSVISDIFNMSQRRVRQLVEEGIIDRVKNGSFELMPTVKKYILYLKASGDSKGGEIDLIKEKAMHERAKREIAEMELAQMKGIMHNAADVEKVMNDMLAAFRAKLLGMPSKVAPLLIAQNEIAIIQDILQKEVYEALEELSNYDPQIFYSEKYIELDEEPVEGDTTDE